MEIKSGYKIDNGRYKRPAVASTLQTRTSGAILGGSGNCIPSGCNYVGIFGCNITAVTCCAFHANTFVAQNMCDASSSPTPTSGSGIFYFCCCGSMGMCCCPVFIA